VKILTWQNPGQLFVAQELINKVKSKCCGIKEKDFFCETSIKKSPSLKNYARHQFTKRTNLIGKAAISTQKRLPTRKSLFAVKQYSISLSCTNYLK